MKTRLDKTHGEEKTKRVQGVTVPEITIIYLGLTSRFTPGGLGPGEGMNDRTLTRGMDTMPAQRSAMTRPHSSKIIRTCTPAVPRSPVHLAMSWIDLDGLLHPEIPVKTDSFYP